MAETMIASEMTEGQVEDLVGKFRAAVRKHRSTITRESAQQALGLDNLGMVVFATFRTLAEKFSNIITRKVVVDITRQPEDVISATLTGGRKSYINSSVVKAMPKGEVGEREVLFLKLNLSDREGYINDLDLDKEVDALGFRMASPYEVAKVNEDDPTFSDEHPNCTHWQNSEGKWCCAIWNRWHDERKVDVGQYGFDWDDYCWFAVVRK